MFSYRMLEPYNAIWSGFGVVVLLFIPAMIVGCCLENLYRRKPKEDRFRGYPGTRNPNAAKKNSSRSNGKKAGGENDIEMEEIDFRL